MAASARISDLPEPAAHRYLIALGSNRWHPRHGPPRATLKAAIAALAESGCAVLAVAPWLSCRPIGPSARTFVNGAVLIASPLDPPALLRRLQAIETGFGRRRRGQAWGARVLDLDIVLWSGGTWHAPDLVIPHTQFRLRDFVLTPAHAIAASWRDPVTGRTLRQLHARLTRPRLLPKPRQR